MKRSTRQVYTERILRVLVFLRKNLDEELSLDEYARVAHFSPYHFHRIFRGMVFIGICYTAKAAISRMPRRSNGTGG
jgi:AraC family transcriptional regulator